ncbi:short chain dehydrogenase [Apiospora rasikravindrae]|uniref:Short chain dehydrogenase n=1 Tax=Apiospora rasikravindrae TaxID=990691 RepID=A0ABR1TDG4_9PEZI
MLTTIFTLLGLTWALSTLLGAFNLVRLYLLTPSKLHHYVYHSRTSGGAQKEQQKEPWAVVTGASDGIGRFLAQELAAAGLNVVLHGRNTAKLEKVQAELQRAHPARSFRLLVADADYDEGQPGLDVEAMAKKELDGLHITVLVNNVGGGIRNPLMGDFLEYSPRQNTEAVSKESLFAMHLTHTLLPQLRKNRPGGALIISVGSMADVGMPLTAMYSACKAFNKTLFETLALEDKLARAEDRGKNGANSSGVEIMYVRLGDVTDVSWRRGTGTLIMPNAQTAARAILARVGCGKSVVTAHWAHELIRLGTGALPDWLLERLLLSIMSGWKAEVERNGGDASASIVGNGFF